MAQVAVARSVVSLGVVSILEEKVVVAGLAWRVESIAEFREESRRVGETFRPSVIRLKLQPVMHTLLGNNLKRVVVRIAVGGAKPRLPHLVDQGWVSGEVGTRGSSSVRIQDQLVDQRDRGQMLCSLTDVAGLQRGGVSQLMLNAHVVLLGDGRTEVGIKCVDSRARETCRGG